MTLAEAQESARQREERRAAKVKPEREIPMVAQPHGGAIQRGNPGNTGGGRTPKAFKKWSRKIINSPDALKAVVTVLENDQHQHFASMWKEIATRAYGKVRDKVAVKGSMQVTEVRVVYDEEDDA